jgi:hypothetical protein
MALTLNSQKNSCAASAAFLLLIPLIAKQKYMIWAPTKSDQDLVVTYIVGQANCESLEE